MLPSIPYIILPMQYAPAKFEAAMSNGLGGYAFTRNIWFDLDLQSLKLLRPMVQEMYYQENASFDLGPKVKGVMVTRNVAQYPRHHVTYAPANLILLHPTIKETMHLQENTLFDLDLRVKVIRNVIQCPLHHVTYAPTEFEVTTSKGLDGEAFTRKFNIWPLTLGWSLHELLPSTLYIMWSIQLQILKLLRLTV